jgi:hypothetical protein
MPVEKAERSLRLFAEGVMPKVTGLLGSVALRN